MSDPAWQLQAAIYAALTASEAITATVYDHVPHGAAMPYIRLDEPGTADWDVSPTENEGGFGKEHTAMIHVWSSYEGKKELNEIMRAVELELREFSPSLADHNVVNFRFQFSDRVEDQDDHSWHGVLQFRAITEEPFS